MSGATPEHSLEPRFSCDACNSRLVYPIDAFQLKSALWLMELRCPECGWDGEASCTEAEFEELDRELDRARSQIQDELTRLQALHMEQWVESFVRALDVDLIVPDDFY